jgi:hypothetical protein
MKLFAALREDTQQGWVWLQDASLPARSVVKIKNPANGKVAYCESLKSIRTFLVHITSRPASQSATRRMRLLSMGGTELL